MKRISCFLFPLLRAPGRWALVGMLAVAAVAVPGKPTAAAARPNVLFIVADDLRTNLGVYGDTVAKTPNIDRLARRGVTFERAYCQQALCNPSRASVLTGLKPDTLRVWNLQTRFRETLPGAVTLPQYFKEQGYVSRDIGKIFHNWHQKVSGDPDSWSVPAVLHFAQHKSDQAQVGAGPLPPNEAVDGEAEMRDVPDEAYFDGRVAAEAVKALRELSSRKEPFFLAVGFWKPHSPFNPPKRYWDMYRRDEIPPLRNPLPPAGAPELALPEAAEIRRERSPEAALELRHGYYAATSYLDAQVGKVVEELERLGIADRTVIVFWSDHGLHLGEHGLWGKTSNFELDLRVPLIVVAPGAAGAGVRTASFAELIDLYPTLVDLCGLPPRGDLEGVSLRPVLANPRAAVRQAAFSQQSRYEGRRGAGKAMGYSVRSADFRYTEWRDWGTGRVIATELYDHRTDPDEMSNVIGEPQLKEIVRSLAEMLRREFPPQPLPAG